MIVENKERKSPADSVSQPLESGASDKERDGDMCPSCRQNLRERLEGVWPSDKIEEWIWSFCEASRADIELGFEMLKAEIMRRLGAGK